MRINHLDEMSVEALRAAAAVAEQRNDALADYKAEIATMPRRMNAAQRERVAYLKGVVSGSAAATREIEKRAPLRIVGSSDRKQGVDYGHVHRAARQLPAQG